MKIPDTLIDYPSHESIETIYQFLQTHPVGVLAEMTIDDLPHASVIYFNIDDQFTVYFVTKVNTQKYRDLQVHQHVSLVVFDQSTQATAQVNGTVAEITNIQESRSIVDSVETIARKYSISGVAPIIKLDTGDYVTYELKPDVIRYAMFQRPNPVTYDAYETLTFQRK